MAPRNCCDLHGTSVVRRIQFKFITAACDIYLEWTWKPGPVNVICACDSRYPNVWRLVLFRSQMVFFVVSPPSQEDETEEEDKTLSQAHVCNASFKYQSVHVLLFA